MADLSSELGISKKTLYKYVSDKRDLILQCMAWHCSQMEHVIEEAKSTSENTIEAELKLIRFIHQIASDMHPSVLFDLNKYHPKAFRMVNERRDEILRGTMEENIRRGQAEGLYREDVNPEVASRFLISLSREVRALAEDTDYCNPALAAVSRVCTVPHSRNRHREGRCVPRRKNQRRKPLYMSTLLTKTPGWALVFLAALSLPQAAAQSHLRGVFGRGASHCTWKTLLPCSMRHWTDPRRIGM